MLSIVAVSSRTSLAPGEGVGACGSATASRDAPDSAAQRVRYRRSIGKTGVKCSHFPAQATGFNGYNHSSEQTRRGKASFDRLVHHSLDHGVSFLDMADLYGSHPFVKDVIKGMPRNKLALLSKIWPQKADWVKPSGGARTEVDRFRKELGTDYLDVCLIHCMQNDKWPTQFHEPIRDRALRAEAKRKVPSGQSVYRVTTSARCRSRPSIPGSM